MEGESAVKITLTSEESVRLEPTAGPMTIEAPTADTQYSPFHMIGGSLAFCTYSILASWASHAGIDPEGLVLDVAWSFAENPHRLGKIDLSFEWPALPPNRRAAAERVAALCPIHTTFHHPPAVTIALRGGEPTPAPGTNAPPPAMPAAPAASPS